MNVAGRGGGNAHPPLWPEGGVSRARVTATLAQALDLTEGEAMGHAVRTAWVADRLATALALEPAKRSRVFWASLLKDAGCSANAHPTASWFGTDDQAAKRDLKRVDWSRPAEAVRYALIHARPGAPLPARFGQAVGLARRGLGARTELVRLRCTRGADVARQLGWVEEIPDAVLYLDEHWDGSGEPYGRQGEAIPFAARLVALAQTVEIFWRDGGPAAALAVARARRGRWFDPALVDTLIAVAGAGDQTFWTELAAVGDPAGVDAWAPPGVADAVIDAGELVAMGAVFGSIVDAKSPWTQRHSERAAEVAAALAAALGWSAEAVVATRLAALWHDLGKLAVSNRVLDKPAPLTPEERQAIERHPALTAAILRPLAPFAAIADAAAAHHERLDGRGYHRRLAGAQIAPMARVVAAADVFEALTAARPYKRPMTPDDAIAYLRAHVGGEFDAAAIDVLAALVRAGAPWSLPAVPAADDVPERPGAS